MQKLEIQTVSVEIKVITVNKKRMTKAVFSQIIVKSCFNENLDFIGDAVLGYIRVNGNWILWVQNGELRRYNINNDPVFQFSIELAKDKEKYGQDYIPCRKRSSDGLVAIRKYYGMYHAIKHLKIESDDENSDNVAYEQHKIECFLENLDKMTKFLNEVFSNQLYISI